MKMWFIPLSVLLMIGLATAADAGPYFNTNAKGVEKLAQTAVKELSDARIEVIRMLSELDAGNASAARERRAQAIGLLKRALAAFSEIEAKVPDQPLKHVPKTPEEKQIYDEFFAALARRKLAIPKTQKELAHLANVVVAHYRDVVETAKVDGFPKEWRGVRSIIRAEIDLLDVGNLASIVWTISG